MTPAEQIAAWADKLRDISAMGLLFSKNIHSFLMDGISPMQPKTNKKRYSIFATLAVKLV